MAYVNPYASAMEYQPRTLWEHPEPYKTDWSTFWGTPREDDDNGDENGDENGYNPEGPKSQVEAGAGSQLKSLWGDVVADMQSGYDLQQSQNMFDSVFGPGITAVTPGTYNPNTATTVPNTTDYVNGWQNPDYTGPQLDTDFITDVSLPANYTGGNTQANVVTQGIDNPTVTSTPVTEFQPSYNQQQQDLIDQSTQAYNQQQNNIQNVPMVTEMIANVPDWRDMVGQGGLTQRQAAQSFANAPTVTYGNTGATNPTLGEILNGYTDPETGAEIDFDAVTDEERDWGDFW